jgi:hypothetical protein
MLNMTGNSIQIVAGRGKPKGIKLSNHTLTMKFRFEKNHLKALGGRFLDHSPDSKDNGQPHRGYHLSW